MQHSSINEPYTSAQLAGQPVPWKMIQRYYGRFQDAYHPEVFEPHVQPEDLRWLSGEGVLAQLAPALTFWQDTRALGMAVVGLGGGRRRAADQIDFAVGLDRFVALGTRVASGDVLARVHARTADAADAAVREILQAINIAVDPPVLRSAVYQAIR